MNGRFVDRHPDNLHQRIRSKIESDDVALHQDRLRHGLSMDGGRGKMKVKNLSVKRLFGRGGNGSLSSIIRYHSPVSCDKTDCGAADGQGAILCALVGILY